MNQTQRHALSDAGDPPDLLAVTNLAERDIDRGAHTAAIPRLQSVLRREPNFAPALAALAQACWLAGRPADGLVHARRAVEIQPPNPHFRLVLAQLCTWLGHADEARAQLATVLNTPVPDPPVHARALQLLAEWHIARGDFAAANHPFRTALALRPDAAAIHTAYGMNLLRLGMFQAAWPEYAWHAHLPSPRAHTDPAFHQLSGRRWSGEPLRGCTILLWDDQGLGDAIQFFRYLPLVREAGPARIVYCTFPALASLLRASAPFVEIVTAPPSLGPSDYQCATSDLPVAFGTRLETIPATVPYLAVPPRHRPPRDRRPSVGLVWAGDPRHLRDHQRSIPADHFLAIADVPGLAFHSLQLPVRASDEAVLAARPAISRTAETLRDFADTAAVVAQLDLVITVDTSAAHLAGALGRPVWILLPPVADWRWLTERDDSPWYPTARLFRAGAGGWAPVLRRVTKALRAAARRHRANSLWRP